MRSTLKLIGTFLLVTFAGTCLVLMTAAPAMAQTDILLQLPSGSTFKLDRENSDNFDDIIVGAIATGHVKVIDGSRGAGAPGGHVKVFDARTRSNTSLLHVQQLTVGDLNMLRPANTVMITHTTSDVSVKFDNAAPLKSPRNGKPVMWTRADGTKWELTSWLKDAALIQVLKSSTEIVTRTFTLSEDGKVLNIKVVLSSRNSQPNTPSPVQLNFNLTVVTQTAVGNGNSQVR